MSMPRLNQDRHLPIIEVTRVACTRCGHQTLSTGVENGVCTACLLAEEFPPVVDTVEGPRRVFRTRNGNKI